MGWQDAPVVEGKKAAWESAPVVGAEKADPVSEAINKSPTAGLLDAGLALGSGAVAGPVSGLAGIAGTLLPGKPGQGADWTNKVQDAINYEPRTPIGRGITKAVSYPFQKLADVADTAGAATSDKTGSPAMGAGVNMALQGVPLVLGRVGPSAGAAETAARALKLKNAPADAAITSAKDAGYVLPPTQVNPSIWNKIAEGFGGKIKTAQDLSIKNQPVTNTLVKQGLGLSEDAPLNAKTLADVRKEAGQSYERVRSSGSVTADPVYGEALDKIAAPFERAAKDFPDAARQDVLDAVKAHRRDTFDAGSAVDQISGLREKADAAYASKDKKAGKAYKDIASAMEEQLGRHLEASGVSPEALADFRSARERIAKTYTVEKHLDQAGNVDAKGLARDLQRGRPLSGELKTAAEFGSNFPKAAQMPEKIGGVPMSPLDHGAAVVSALAGLASGHPQLALAGALPYTRPMLRKLLTSEAYQNAAVNPPSYGPSTMSRLQQLQSLPSIQALEMAEGQRK